MHQCQIICFYYSVLLMRPVFNIVSLRSDAHTFVYIIEAYFISVAFKAEINIRHTGTLIWFYIHGITFVGFVSVSGQISCN